MNCDECQPLLLDLAYGELEPARAALVQAHVDGCAKCQAELALLGGVRSAMAPIAQVEEPSAGFDEKLVEAARAEVASRNSGQVISLEAVRKKRRPWFMGAMVAGSVAAAAGLALVVTQTDKSAVGPAQSAIAEQQAIVEQKAQPAAALQPAIAQPDELAKRAKEDSKAPDERKAALEEGQRWEQAVSRAEPAAKPAHAQKEMPRPTAAGAPAAGLNVIGASGKGGASSGQLGGLSGAGTSGAGAAAQPFRSSAAKASRDDRGVIGGVVGASLDSEAAAPIDDVEPEAAPVAANKAEAVAAASPPPPPASTPNVALASPRPKSAPATALPAKVANAEAKPQSLTPQALEREGTSLRARGDSAGAAQKFRAAAVAYESEGLLDRAAQARAEAVVAWVEAGRMTDARADREALARLGGAGSAALATADEALAHESGAADAQVASKKAKAVRAPADKDSLDQPAPAMPAEAPPAATNH